jgi:hypothetical protein
MICIEAAGIWKYPQSCASDSLFLPPDCRPRPVEASPIRAKSKNRHPAWLVLPDFSLERSSACAIFVVSQLGRGCRCTSHDCGNAVPGGKKLVPFARMEKSSRKTRSVQCRPEPVSGAREMKTRRAGVKSWIDTAEQDLEIRRNEVGHLSAMCALKIFCGRTAERDTALHIRGGAHFILRTTGRRHVKC